jgi:rhodanese-related sulfurtransferase
MPKNFAETVAASRAGIPVLTPADAQDAMAANPETIVLDVRDTEHLNITGIIPGSAHVSMGTLFYSADHEMPDEYRSACLADKNRPIITTCTLGAVASIAARTLKDYGFTNVSILDGGNKAWGEAGLPLEQV